MYSLLITLWSTNYSYDTKQEEEKEEEGKEEEGEEEEKEEEDGEKEKEESTDVATYREYIKRKVGLKVY